MAGVLSITAIARIDTVITGATPVTPKYAETTSKCLNYQLVHPSSHPLENQASSLVFPVRLRTDREKMCALSVHHTLQSSDILVKISF